MSSEHSTVSPSGLYRVLACPGSVQECKKVPLKPPSIYAERGTLQHAAVVKRWYGRPISRLGLEQDELNNVDDAVDYLRSVISNRTYQLTMEIKRDLSIIGIPQIWGTVDVDLDLDADKDRQLHIIDWKFGSGVPVLVDDNEQLLAYLMMAAGERKNNGGVMPDRMFIHLAQPPMDYYGVQEVTRHDLNKFAARVKTGYAQAMSPNAPLLPGEKQCKFCPAAMSCKARYRFMLEKAHDVFEGVEKLKSRPDGTPPSVVVTNDESANLYKKLMQLQDYASDLAKYGFSELKSGRKYGDFKLVRGRSIRKWHDEKRAAQWLFKYAGLKQKDLYKDAPMISPAQAEKLNRRLKKDDDFKQLVNKPEGALKMAPADDKRKAVDMSADKVFEGVD